MANGIVFPEGAYMERDEDAPELFSVWLEDDLIGAGETAEEAMGEALDQLAVWEANEALS